MASSSSVPDPVKPYLNGLLDPDLYYTVPVLFRRHFYIFSGHNNVQVGSGSGRNLNLLACLIRIRNLGIRIRKVDKKVLFSKQTKK
jgi:hypothetical protein